MDRYSILTKELRSACPGLELRENEPMSVHTTFRVGGPARLMALPKTEEEAAAAVRTAAELGVTPFYLGNGSNLLVADRGYDGFIVKPAGALDQVREIDGGLMAGGGVLLSRLAHFAAERGLTGLEFAAGIPGSVGGAVTMNAGAYGGEMCQVVRAVRYLGESDEAETLTGAGLDFSYRRSAFSDGKRLILGAEFRLSAGDPAEIKSRMAELNARRREKQPLEYPSAGSTFKRPAPVDGQPQYAAALIDQCGLKGRSVGGAQVSEKHAGFIVNRGGATADDILKLADLVRETVLWERGVALELEIRTLGF